MNQLTISGSGIAEDVASLTRAECEDFLYHEAALLDEWRLDEWLELFVEGATYEVPTAGAAANADSADELFYIADDYFRLQHRIRRLKKKEAHSEWPRTQGCRLISNVRLLGPVDGGQLIASAFITFRSKDDLTDRFFGHHRHVLRKTSQGIRIFSKRSMLEMGNLRPQGRVSIII